MRIHELLIQKRIERLLVLLSLGFAWAHRLGEWMAAIKPISLKNCAIKKDLKTAFSD